jgi:hypothetical protein
MAKYVRSLDPKRKNSLAASLARKSDLKTLMKTSVCRCPEASEGEHECPAVEARELLSKKSTK